MSLRLGAWLVAALVVGLTPVEVEAQAQAPASAQAREEVLSVQAKPWTGDFDGMVERRRIRILTPYSKTHFFIDRGQPRGLVAEMAAKLEDQINLELKTPRDKRVYVIVKPTSRDALYQSLVDGLGDVIAAGVTVTPEREKLVDFTIPGRTGVKQIVVTGPGASVLSSVDDLAGKKVVVREKSIFHESLTALSESFQKRGLHPITIKSVPTALEDEDILEMVSAGMITATVVDDYVAAFWSQILPNLKVHANLVVRDGGDVAWAMRKGSPKLLDVLNRFAEKNRIGTAVGNVLFQRYLKSTAVVKSATSSAELTKFTALRVTFAKYAKEYDLDHVLMMAQGYQESRLDQSVKSHVGAVGVMQVMPATGKELAVGNIQQIDPNVHAGVKYIRFMIDRYYANEPMDRLNKMLFAFASYNAGPARVRGLRAEASKRGLDPNQWFNHVEQIASERIGRETVQYVSNIYKYYVAYSLAIAELAERKALREKVGSGQ
jgi:membrane-bound lytic murein transglycosylase MltF